MPKRQCLIYIVHHKYNMHHANYKLCSRLTPCCVSIVSIQEQNILVTTFDQSKIKTVASAEQSVTEPLLVLQNIKK